MNTKDYQEVEKLLEQFQKLSLTFVVGDGITEKHAKLSNFFLEALTTYGKYREQSTLEQIKGIAEGMKKFTQPKRERPYIVSQCDKGKEYNEALTDLIATLTKISND